MKTILITGTTKGIGKKLFSLCKRKGYNTLALNRPKFDLKNPNYTLPRIYKNINTIVLNAGTFSRDSLREFSFKLSRGILETNLIGNMLLVHKLVTEKRLAFEPLIVFILTEDLLRHPSLLQEEYTYAISKKGLEYFATLLENSLVSRIRKVYLPLVDTQMLDYSLPITGEILSAEQAAEIIMEVINGTDLPSYRPI